MSLVPAARRLVRAVSLGGVGLHSGRPCRAAILPAPPGSGRRIGTPDAPPVPLEPHLADPASRRCTTLRLPGGSVSTVEHLLAAVAGLGLLDLTVVVEGPEAPLLDGSALPWAKALWAASEPTEAPPNAAPPVPFGLRVERSSYRVTPDDRFRARVDYTGPTRRPGGQRVWWEGGGEEFATRVAGARTFATAADAAALRAEGRALGGTAETAVLFGPEGPLGGPLRFPDEPARHKLLDLIGDLATLGRLPPVRIEATAPSHAANAVLARRLAGALGAAGGG